MGTQLRHGGDIKGLQDSLDYLVGMGIKGVYLAGSLHINAPWVGWMSRYSTCCAHKVIGFRQLQSPRYHTPRSSLRQYTGMA